MILLVFLSLFVICGLSSNSQLSFSDCPKEDYCTCKYDNNSQVIVSCDLSKSRHNVSLKLPNTTRILDLSNSNLSRVPSQLFIGLSHLRVLSLSQNVIQVIHENAFQYLTGLKFLNLSYNNLVDWKGSVSTDLPSLDRIDITGNPVWLPDKLLNISSLTKITGATWSLFCVNCDLWRSNNMTFPPILPTLCNQAAKYLMQGFKLDCANKVCKPNCKLPHERLPKPPKQVSNTRKVWFYAGYGTGALAIIVNSIVLINVLLSKSLRCNLSMILICNMAACDIMIGCYAIVVSNSNIYDIASGLEWDIKKSRSIQVNFPFCTVATVLNTVGLIVSVVTSLLLTVEKYMCIVYCMNPDVRLKMKHAMIVMVTIWIASLLFALCPEYGFIPLTYSLALMCTMPVNKGSKPTFVIYPLSVIAMNYFLMIPMYARIFRVVRHSSTQMRISRNAVLAKKVLIMICTNFVFFSVPMSLLIAYAFSDYESHKKTALYQPMLDFIVYVWLPVQLLALNSLLNPFLYAFRYRKFQKEFRARLSIGDRITAQLRRALSRMSSSKMSNSPSSSRIELYQIGRAQSVDIHGGEKQRSRVNSQIPTTESAVILQRTIPKTVQDDAKPAIKDNVC